MHKINSNIITSTFVFLKDVILDAQRNSKTIERTSDFPSSIAITVFVVKTVAWRSTNTIASRRDGKLQKQLPPADTRNIVTFLLRMTFNFQAGNVSRAPDRTHCILYRIENTIYPVHIPNLPLFVPSMQLL